MTPPGKRTPKGTMFVHGPFVICPECGKETFGVLSIFDRHYARRCTSCYLDKQLSLPALDKRVVYLDQFVISNMMKELDPDRPDASKGAKGGFFRTLFEKLDRLTKLQLLVCPDSPVHDHESAVLKRHEKLRSVFRHLSHGLSLRPPEKIFHAQMLCAFRAWLRGEVPVPRLERDFAFSRKFNVWNDRLRIELNYTLPGLADSLRAAGAERTRRLREVCTEWEEANPFRFDEVFAVELLATLRAPLVEYLQWMQRMTEAEWNPPTDHSALFPPPSADLIAHMLAELKGAGVPPGAHLDRLGEFLNSEAARRIRFARISALAWAGVAREVHLGRNPETVGSGMLNDIDQLAAYSPFCDAMFVDKQIALLAAQGELKDELGSGARLYSLHNDGGAAFLAYLDSIEQGAPAGHLEKVAEVYGKEWPKPFLELLEYATR
ncbi:MAG TPA: hypothetical protein VMB21_15250 [Candidatus Limnocylindria bacterium]|jgi:hypothetical protein|nr:hypothetical protein [Candidatus Limnocylindria bacterium]HTL67240.1 hypothetical protein [Lacunisphaera sp.]